MPRRNKPEFPLTPDLDKFRYEVATEIGISNKQLISAQDASKLDKRTKDK